MIIKKPYAFLIKRFRLIHFILFILLVYLMITSFNIFSFYSDYANSTFAPNVEYASSYITIFTFIGCLLILAINLIIYYLLNIKKKPKKLYLFMCVFYIIEFIYIFIMLVYFKDLEYNVFSYEKVRVIRDICLLFLIPQAVLSFMVLGRSLGFNLKEFEFNKDIDDLEIDEKDYEEVEISIGKNSYKYKRTIRKSIRLLKYFILENKFFITILSSMIALSVSLVIFLNLRVYNEHYNEEQQFIANTVWYKANNSYLAYKDIYGNEIAKDRFYLLVNINMTNKLNRKLSIDRNTFRLKMSGELYVPKFTYGEQFLDVGETFTQTVLYEGESKNMVVVFELDEKQLKKEYVIRVKNATNISFGELESEFIDIVVKPRNVNVNTDIGRYNLPSELTFKNTILQNTKMLISSAVVQDSFREYYENCYNNKCEKYSYIVKPTGKGNAVLRVKSKVTLDNSLYISDFIKYPKNFYKYYSKIYYRYEGVTKEVAPNIIFSQYGQEEYTYFEVPEKMKNANRIEMLLDVRGSRYTIVLK